MRIVATLLAITLPRVERSLAHWHTWARCGVNGTRACAPNGPKIPAQGQDDGLA